MLVVTNKAGRPFGAIRLAPLTLPQTGVFPPTSNQEANPEEAARQIGDPLGVVVYAYQPR
jgi:hypothetical protein